MTVQTRFSEPITKDEATKIVASMSDATDTTMQRESSNTMVWVLMFQQNVNVMVDAGSPYAIVKALGEWKDRIAIGNIARSLRSLPCFYSEDRKVQLFELLVPHVGASDVGMDSTDEALVFVLYDLAAADPLSRQRLRDVPDVMHKLGAFEQYTSNPFLTGFLPSCVHCRHQVP